MTIEELLARNRAWAQRQQARDPDMFRRLARGQRPICLWIGCSDSRVAPETIVDVPPGTLFVHRNIANLVRPTDLNFLSVLEFALTALEVEDIVVCGHEGCGGIARALEGEPQQAVVDYWLQPVRELAAALPPGEDQAVRLRRLVELNVRDQLRHLAQLPPVRAARRRRPLRLHGLVFEISTGRLRRLEDGDGLPAGGRD